MLKNSFSQSGVTHFFFFPYNCVSFLFTRKTFGSAFVVFSYSQAKLTFIRNFFVNFPRKY